MVAYGEALKRAAEESPFDPRAYLDYEALKALLLLYDLEKLHFRPPVEENAMSLTVTPATNAAAMPMEAHRDEDASEPSSSAILTHDSFLLALDAELKKLDAFAHGQVVAVRKQVRQLEARAAAAKQVEWEGCSIGDRGDAGLADAVASCGDRFLAVEKYVNDNITGIRKLLKKHDKVLPERPCMAFYTARLHDMRWVRHDYSDVVVRLSRLNPTEPASAKGDDEAHAKATTKYWVPPAKLSAVKLALSRRLPVVLEGGVGPTSPEKASSVTDSQLVNTVYLDSPSLELYHGRLSKTPGAVALRLRWYGAGEPRRVFVERKTHRDAWAGDETVRDRFAVLPEDVPRLLTATYDPTEAPIEYALKQIRLVDEVQRLINTKGLVPTIRSQCYRSAFARADSTAVRAAIDTNLCLVSEVATEEESSLQRWFGNHRGNHVARFPFAVLEIKLALDDADDLPGWVKPIVDSLVPVHKFSKYIHGAATLLPDEVQAVPYWTDEPALKETRFQTPVKVKSPESFGNRAVGAAALRPVAREWHDGERRTQASIQRREEPGCFQTVAEAGPLEPGRVLEGGCCESEREPAAGLLMPKDLFANERTFIKWVHVAVILVSFGSTAFAFADAGARFISPAARFRAACYGGMLCVGASVLACYALLTYRWRARHILAKDQPEWGDPQGPLLVTFVVVFMLLSAWVAEMKVWLSSS